VVKWFSAAVKFHLHLHGMKKILLLSDTHGYLDPSLLKYIDWCDEVWHAGDIGEPLITLEIEKLKPLRAVWGNIDGQTARKLYQEDELFTINELKVYITHIGGPLGKYNHRVKEIMKTEKPGLFICGHSHILKVVYDKENELLYMNPGAAGKSGFHQVKTILLFEIETAEVKNLRVVELGKRAGT